jgi:hypothetical protein
MSLRTKKNADGTYSLTIDNLVAPGSGVESKSGKSEVLFSTRGASAVALPDGTQIKANINVYVTK